MVIIDMIFTFVILIQSFLISHNSINPLSNQHDVIGMSLLLVSADEVATGKSSIAGPRHRKMTSQLNASLRLDDSYRSGIVCGVQKSQTTNGIKLNQ